MTFHYTQNYFPPTGTDVIFQFKELLVSAGWTVVASSDGITNFSNSGDILTSSASGAYGLGNTWAWFVAKQAGSTRSLVFQRGQNSSYWLVAYSVAGFTATLGTLQGLPTATDEVFLLGNNTQPGTGVFAILFNIDKTYYTQLAADDANGNGAYFFCYTNEQSLVQAGFLFDPILPGTISPLDQDPYVLYIHGYTLTGNAFGTPDLATAAVNIIYDQSGTSGWIKYGNSNGGFANLPTLAYTCIPTSSSTPVNMIPGGLNSNLYDGYDQVFPAVYARGPYTIAIPYTNQELYVASLFAGDGYFNSSNANILSPGDYIKFAAQPSMVYNITSIIGDNVYISPTYSGPNILTFNTAEMHINGFRTFISILVVDGDSFFLTNSNAFSIGDSITFDFISALTYTVTNVVNADDQVFLSVPYDGTTYEYTLVSISNYANVNPNDPPPYYTTPPGGYKGVSSMMQWKGTNRGSLDILGISTAGDHIVVNQVLLPWNNSTIAVL